MKISCELKERRFGSRVISGGHYPRAGISVRSSVEEDIWLFTNKMVTILSSLGLCERRTPQFNLHGKA
jgi:hypothetical protein